MYTMISNVLTLSLTFIILFHVFLFLHACLNLYMTVVVLPWSLAEATDIASHSSHCRRHDCIPARQCAVRLHTGHVRLSSSCSSRHRSSSRQICGHRTVLIWTQSTTESGVWCRSAFTRLLSETPIAGFPVFIGCGVYGWYHINVTNASTPCPWEKGVILVFVITFTVVNLFSKSLKLATSHIFLHLLMYSNCPPHLNYATTLTCENYNNKIEQF